MSPLCLFLSLFLLLSSCSTPWRYTLMRAAEFKPFRTPPRHNHVITRIKRSLLVGTNLISEFPAANYLYRRWSRPVMDPGSNRAGSKPRADATRPAAPSQFKTISEITPCGTRSAKPSVRLFSSPMRRKTAQCSWISCSRDRNDAYGHRSRCALRTRVQRWTWMDG